jgi:hypothetical protein
MPAGSGEGLYRTLQHVDGLCNTSVLVVERSSPAYKFKDNTLPKEFEQLHKH